MSALLFLAALTVTRQDAGAPIEPRLMRYPSVHGDNVVFTYASDLWLGSLKGGYARRLTSSTGQEVRGRISPDGTMVAFTAQYDGNPDVYVMPIDGGEPKRLTFEPGGSAVSNWTPDGKIMYSSAYGSYTARQPRLWMVDPKGGMPIWTRVEEFFDGSMSADGHTLVYQRIGSNNFNWRRYRGGSQGRVSIYDMATNKYSELPSAKEQSYEPMVVGDSIYYISDKTGGTLNLYKYDQGSKRETQLTHFTDEDIKWPSTDGKTIVFEKDGYLWAYNIATGDDKRLNPTIKTDNVPARPYMRQLSGDISAISLSPSGARVAVEARGEIFSVPARGGDTHNLTNASASRERFPAWSPDGKTIAYASDASGDYEVYTIPQLGGTPTKLTDAHLPIASLNWSPDGKLLMIGTRSYELYALDVVTKALKKVYASNGGGAGGEFSPDGKWIAYVNVGTNRLAAVHLYEIATAKDTQISSGEYSDSRASWDMGGKYLYIVSDRTFQPTFGNFEFSLKVENSQRVYVLPLTKDQTNPLVAPNEEEPETGLPPILGDGGGPGGAGGGGLGGPGGGQGRRGGGGGGGFGGGGFPGGAPPALPLPNVKIDTDHMAQRMIPLPLPASTYQLAIGARDGVYLFLDGSLVEFSLTARQLVPLVSLAPAPAAGGGGRRRGGGGGGGLRSFDLNNTRTRAAFQLGEDIMVVDLRPGSTPTPVSTASVETVVNPREEWSQMFWEAWRFERDNYYDPAMVGLDWKAIGNHYAKYLPYVSHRGDLNYVLGLLIAELGTGHSYVSGGDLGPSPAPIPIGQLAVDFVREGDNVKMAKIYRGDNFDEQHRAPFGEPGITVNDGEYLLEIDGKPVHASEDPNALLVGKVGQMVTVTVNSTPSTVGARKIRIRPIGSETAVRNWAWQEANKDYVSKASNGKIGYMYITDTALPGAIDFIRGYYSQVDKDAMVVDERWNGGGYIQPWFIDTLARKTRAGIKNRHGAPSEDAVSLDGPKAMLINGYAGSGGDFFPWMFRQAKLGPLIGKRTWGGLVGISSGAPLLDGGSVTAPEFGIFDRENGEWIAENKGISPDIDVDSRPDLRAIGQDPQLDAAIKYLMDQLKKGSPQYKTPPFPVNHIGG